MLAALLLHIPFTALAIAEMIEMSTRYQFRLGALSDILGSDEMQVSEYGPTRQGARLRPVGDCTLKLTATGTDPSIVLQSVNDAGKAERELDVPMERWDDIVLGDATWSFDIQSHGRFTDMDYDGQINVQHTDLTDFRPTQDQDKNKGIGFEGDFTIWEPCPPAFREQDCHYIMFCVRTRQEPEYDQSTGTWELEWEGRLFRGGNDVDQRKANAAQRKKGRSKESTFDG